MTGKDAFRLSFGLLLPQFDAAGAYSMNKNFLSNKIPNEGSFTFSLSESGMLGILRTLSPSGL